MTRIFFDFLFQVLHKWGEYSQDVQFILQRSSLDGGNRGGGPLSPPLQRSKFGPTTGAANGPQQQQQQPAQNTKARSVEPPPPAVWKPPPFPGKQTGGTPFYDVIQIQLIGLGAHSCNTS